MTEKSLTGRRTLDQFMRGLAMVASAVGIIFLVWILWDTGAKGISSMDLDFFTKRASAIPKAEMLGIRQGVGNAIVGTLYITFLATLVGTPLGLMSGIFLSEFARNHPLATSVRFFANTLMGTPSILIGVFIYALIVVPFGHFSGYAGAIALAIIMFPVVTRTTEDILNLVPNELRESALALGAPRWKMITQIVFRAAKSGLMTGVLLAVARVSGETAPLLMTAFNSPFYTYYNTEGPMKYVYDLSQPTPTLTVTIYNYARMPDDELNIQAWGASLLIAGAVLLLSVVARILFQGGQKQRG